MGDGYEVARALRADSKLRGLALIAVTGYGREEDRLQALHAGFDAHVPKPIDIEKLESLLREAPVRAACAKRNLKTTAMRPSQTIADFSGHPSR